MDTNMTSEVELDWSGARSIDGGIVVEVPDGEADRVANQLAAEGHAVEVRREQKETIRTVADLLRANREGLRVEIVVPCGDGATLTVPVWLAAGAVVLEKVTRIRAQAALKVKQLTTAIESEAETTRKEVMERFDAAKAKAEAGGTPDLDSAADVFADVLGIGARFETEAAAHLRTTARKLYDAGMVTKWDEDVVGMPLTPENFVEVFGLPGFSGALIARFMELNFPRAQQLEEEGKG